MPAWTVLAPRNSASVCSYSKPAAFSRFQTMSAQSYNLLAEVPTMREMGIDILRISPQPTYTAEIVAAFDAARNGRPAAANAAWNPEGLVDGYWFGDAGIAQRHTQAVTELQGA